MTADLRGAAKESTDVEPIGRNKVERDAMYTPNEKKRLKPEECFQSGRRVLQKKNCSSCIG